MRYQGRVADWNDDRGFGFVAPNDGGSRLFLHISELTDRSTRPSEGVLVTYEIGKSADGRPRAQAVRFVSASSSGRAKSGNLTATLFLLAVIVPVVVYVAWVRISYPGSSMSASIYKIIFAREALRSNTQFQCTPQKSSCSAMTSCAEAFFHQEKCGVPNMDGDRDGIPCEQQWCTLGGSR
jgi:cold shock CspA family protein